MADPFEIISQNLTEVRQRITDAASRSGRDPKDVRLIAVTKYVPAEIARLLVRARATELAESRPQELWPKAELLQDAGVTWHLVGHLQRNKVRRTVQVASWIHSVDSEKLLQAIAEEATTAGRFVEVLLEVNVSGDEAKHGFRPEDLASALSRIPSSTAVAIRGFMTMARRQGGQEVARRDFAKLRQLRDELAVDAAEHISLDELSMGMSGDYEQAIAEGATMVRVGRALYKGLEPPRS
ncbi:MAG: YggS family pyridoxal phosphate-dependent enzyme [Pirellulales bacterium]